MKRYTNNTDGSVYGWAQSVGQGGFDRLSFKTSFDNTFLAGAWTTPGGGFEGAIDSGILCSNRILKEEHIDNITTNNNFSENSNITRPIDFLNGMCANLNKEKAIDCNIEYDFTDEGKFYVQVKNKEAKVLDKKPEKVDVSVKTSYTTWYEIGTGKKKGAIAYMDGELKFSGSIKISMRLPKMFSQKSKK